MSADELAGLILFSAITLGVALMFLMYAIEWVSGFVSKLSFGSLSRYVTHDDAAPAATEPRSAAFERPEPPRFVQAEQAPNTRDLTYDDGVRLDTIARLIAAGVVSESAALPAVYDGRGGLPALSKGGSVAYTSRRDDVRRRATGYGWRPAAQYRPVVNGAPQRQATLDDGGELAPIENAEVEIPAYEAPPSR